MYTDHEHTALHRSAGHVRTLREWLYIKDILCGCSRLDRGEGSIPGIRDNTAEEGDQGSGSLGSRSQLVSVQLALVSVSLPAWLVTTTSCCVSLTSLYKIKRQSLRNSTAVHCEVLELGAISRKLNSWPLLPCILLPRRRADLGGDDMFDKGWRRFEWIPLLAGFNFTVLGSEQWTCSCPGPLAHFDGRVVPFIFLMQPHPGWGSCHKPQILQWGTRECVCEGTVRHISKSSLKHQMFKARENNPVAGREGHGPVPSWP